MSAERHGSHVAGVENVPEQFTSPENPPAEGDVAATAVQDATLHRWFLASLVGVCLVFIISAVVLYKQSQKRRTTTTSHSPTPWRNLSSAIPASNTVPSISLPCDTDGCTEFGKLLKSCLGATDPCDDFSAFVCASGPCTQPLLYRHHADMLNRLTAETLSRVRVPTTDRSPTENAALLYQSCSAGKDREDLKAFADLLARHDLNFSIAGSDRVNPQQIVFNLAGKYQDGILFWIGTRPASSSSGGGFKTLLTMTAHPKFLRMSAAPEKRNMTAFQEYVMRTLEAFEVAANQREAIARAIVATSLEVDELWRKLGSSSSSDPLVIKIGDLDARLAPSASASLLSSLPAQGYSIDDDIVVESAGFLDFLRSVLALDWRSVAPYLSWEFSTHLGALISDMLVPPDEYHWQVSSKTCMAAVERVTGFALHAPTLFEFVNRKTMSGARAVVDGVFTAAAERMESVTSLSSVSKKDAVAGLNRTRVLVGYPHRFNTVEKVNSHYAFIPSLTGRFPRDYYTAAAAYWQQVLNGSEPYFPLLATSPNVLYSEQVLFVPAAYLMPRIYADSGSLAMKYGTLGLVAARAACHAMGLTAMPGSKSTAWWNDTMRRRFHDQKQCLGYRGTWSVEDAQSLADALAVTPLYDAYGGARGALSHLPNLTGPQVFFAATCLPKCGFGGERCNAGVRNTWTFERAFGCTRPAGESPCTLW